MPLFDRLKGALQKTKTLLNTDVRDLFRQGEILDESILARFEKNLIETDMGVAAADSIVQELREKHLGRTIVVDELRGTIKQKLSSLLRGEENVRWDETDPLSPLNLAESGPTVILVAGVNGVGKTTSIAKLAHFLQKSGQRVILAAGDTFRAAAVEQLTLWAGRLGCEIITRPSGTDPASVAYAACERALEAGLDCCIVDTAGRLQTHKNLMEELGKIHRVIGKKIDGAPHENLLVLDATTGQNGISQARHFTEAVHCTGIVLAKLDGTAKGGVVVAIRQHMGIPVKYIGTGEKIDDLEMFQPDRFAEALFA
ncbi:MAG: signal recognition particle-docking protein FtsY [Planctomycetaceae bacterium]